MSYFEEFVSFDEYVELKRFFGFKEHNLEGSPSSFRSSDYNVLCSAHLATCGSIKESEDNVLKDRSGIDDWTPCPL